MKKSCILLFIVFCLFSIYLSLKMADNYYDSFERNSDIYINIDMKSYSLISCNEGLDIKIKNGDYLYIVIEIRNYEKINDIHKMKLFINGKEENYLIEDDVIKCMIKDPNWGSII